MRRVIRGGRLSWLALSAALTCAVFGAAAAADAPNPVGVAELRKSDLDGKPMLAVEAEPNMVDVLSSEPAKYVAVSGFTSADRRLNASVKRYEKVTLALHDWPIDEFMYFVSGTVEITNAQGLAKRYSAGDAIVLPKGFSGTWKQLSTIEMMTVAYEPTQAVVRRAQGRKFFEEQVLPKIAENGCPACHAVGYVHPNVTQYDELLPYLAMGDAPEKTAVIRKIANLRAIAPDRPTHPGGQRCKTLGSEPCQSIIRWWELEFGMAQAATRESK